MDGIKAGQIFALYLFDVAEAIDLEVAAARVSGGTRARIVPKAQMPAYFQYQEPPILFDGGAIEGTALQGFHTVFRVFDYGVVALRLSQPFAGTWTDLAASAQAIVDNDGLERHAEQACRILAGRLGDSLTAPRSTLLSEDYVVFAVNELDHPQPAASVLSAHGDVIAQLLRGESAWLSAQERDEVLSNRISYLADDLVIPTWNSAFVYDTPAGAQAAVEIFEFANSVAAVPVLRRTTRQRAGADLRRNAAKAL